MIEYLRKFVYNTITKPLKKEVEKINGMLSVACDMLETGVYTKDKYLDRVKVLDGRLDLIQEHLKVLSVESTEKETAQNAIPILEKVLSDYPLLAPADKNKLLKAIIEKVVYNKNAKDFTLDVYLKI